MNSDCFFLLCLLNPRKPEQADDLLDKMRDLRDTTEEVDNTLMENAEDGLDNADLDDLMAEKKQLQVIERMAYLKRLQQQLERRQQLSQLSFRKHLLLIQ